MSEHLGRSKEDYETLVLKEISKLPNNTQSIENIISILEDLEENINITIEEHSVTLLQIQFLCYLISYDLENAKFFWARIPNEKKQNQILQEIHKILYVLWSGQQNAAFQLIAQVNSNLNNKSISSLLHMLHTAVFQKILKEITLNYANLSIKEFQILLALNEQDTFKTIQKLNWKTDEQSFVYPDAKYLMDKEKFKQINEEQIDQITKLYRKKTIPIPYPFQERFDVFDGQYLIPKPPLKPLSAYNVFTLMYMRIIRENYPNEPTSVILKKLSSLWNDDEFMIDHKLEIYLKERYTKVQEELQTSDIATITQHVTNSWNNIPEEQKQEYQQKYKDNIVNFKTAIAEYDKTFRIPLKQYKNIYNLFVIDQYQGKKIKFKDLEEHQQFTKQLQVTFNQLSSEEKQVYEQKKIKLDEQMNQEVEKFKKYFDLSEQDYQDIQKLVKSQQKTKDINEDHQLGFI
ncbi:hypothetical protein ABPG73_010496 [Tetrahymena malaccensis]